MAGGAQFGWKVMDLTHGRSDGTLNPDPTHTQIVERVLDKLPRGALPAYRYIWLLPERYDGCILREVAEDGSCRSLDVLWLELARPSAGCFWQEWGVENPVVELSLEERLFIALAQVAISRGHGTLRRRMAAEIMRTVVTGKRRLADRYSYLLPEKYSPEFESAEEYIRFLGQPVIDPGDVSETVNYLEF